MIDSLSYTATELEMGQKPVRDENLGHWASCIAAPQVSETLSGDAQGAPGFSQLHWDKMTLRVQFMGGMARTWKRKTYPGNCITTDDILRWANKWSSGEDLEGKVPRFELYIPNKDQGDSDIRVKFVCKLAAVPEVNHRASYVHKASYLHLG